MKILYTIVYVVKFMIFGNERGYDTRSHDFSLRRIFAFILLIFLILTNVILAKHAALLNKELIATQHRLDVCDLQCKK